MKNDIKKKFIDILFEPDDDEDEGYEIPQPKKPVPKTARSFLPSA